MFGSIDHTKRAKSAQLTVRLDEQLKRRAELNLEVMGMTATEAVEQLYRFIAEHGRMPLQARVVTTEINPLGRMAHAAKLLTVPGADANAVMADMAEAQRADFMQNVMNVQGEEAARTFARYFLNFLSNQGVSCSNRNLFEDVVTERARKHGKCAAAVSTMQDAQRMDVSFTFHNVTLDELPHFAESLPGELIAEFGFTADEATAVLNQIRPARDGRPR